MSSSAFDQSGHEQEQPYRSEAEQPTADNQAEQERRLLDEVLREEVELAYIGRDEAASPAVGVSQTPQDEQQEIVEQALNVQHNRLVLDLKQEDGIQGAGEQQVGTGE